MNKLITLCALFILISTNALANPFNLTDPTEFKDGQITGVVIDDALNEPLPYVNIVVNKSNGELLTGGITNDDGSFKIEKVPEGTYEVIIQFIGFKPEKRSVTITRKESKIKLGEIRLVEEAEGLDEVTVVAEVSTIQQKVDRKVITIGKDLAASGTASELMVGIPSVSVDSQTGDIALRGNQNVRVMVDGKFSNIPTAQLLKQIPSSSIKSVELITNPSAKYDPDGMSGIINIVLHKNTMVGFNGSLSTNFSYERQPKFNSSLNMNYRNGKFNFYGNYSGNISKNANYGFVDRIDQDILQEVDILDKRKSNVFKVGVDFYLNEKNTISVFANRNSFDGGTTGGTDIFYADDTVQNQGFDNEGDNSSEQYNFNYSLDFSKEGRNLELEVDHNMYDGDSFTNNLFSGNAPNIRTNFFELTNTERDRTTINLDYVDPLNETTKLEFGLQARLFSNAIDYESDGRSQNEMGDYIPSLTYFDYSRNIYSAYANLNKKINKWNIQVGLRAETVKVETLAEETDLITNQVTVTPFDNDYFQVYPSAFVTYSPSQIKIHLPNECIVDVWIDQALQQVNPISQNGVHL